MPGPVLVSAAVEGIVDEAVVRRLILEAGGRPGTVYGKNGKSHLRQKIDGYNNAAHRSPWIVLVDLDRDEECAPPLLEEWLPRPAPHLCFRVAVREVEAWLMADAKSLAAFLGVAPSRIPAQPEETLQAKETMVNLARHSRRRAVREDMVPRERSGRQVGPAYTSRLIEFVESKWRPEVAAKSAGSLRRAMDCLRNLIVGAP